MRRLLIVGFLVCAVVWPGSPARAQMRRGRIPIYDSSQVTPSTDRGVQQAMKDAQELVNDRQYVQAVMRLQSVLDHSEDYFIGKDFKSRNVPHPAVKAQTQWILSRLPPEGRAAYELHFGTAARTMLNRALAANDMDQVALVAERFQLTAAGFDALQILAAAAFDHDQPLEAAVLCEAMAEHPKVDNDRELRGKILLRTAFAWYLAGQTDRSQTALIKLKALDIPKAWQIGSQKVPPIQNEQQVMTWLQTHFGPPSQPLVQIVNEWILPRGGLTGNESASETCPAGGGDWSISPFKYIRFLLDDEANQKLQVAFENLSHQIERILRDDNRLIQPCVMPLVIGDTVVYRTLNDVTAVSLKTGQLLWRSSLTDGMVAWLLQNSNSDNESLYNASPTTLPGYVRYKLFRDQRSGSLTSDGNLIYAVEESDSQFDPLRVRSRQTFSVDPANKLVAYELSGGRLVWEVGGPSGTPPAELAGIFFLGPPLPLNGRLYCLAEVKDELCLMALIPEGASVRVEWTQSLITVNKLDSAVPVRRQAGLIPVVSDGIMICSTGNGYVIGFDLVRRQLIWGYSYDLQKTRQLQEGFEYLPLSQIYEEEGRWLDQGAVICGSKVILTPRDSNELHCLNLLDGSVVWKRNRNQGLYVACVHQDSVIVVGRTEIVAYSLMDGAEKWAEPIEIPEPSGRGVRIGSRYLLPLSTGEIATLELSTGRILGRSKLPDGTAPGNLAIGQGALVSVGIHDVIGFRPLSEIERQIAKLATNPHDAEALALRGELRLHNGEEEAAINDLRESLREQPRQRVKRVLAGTMLNVLKNDLPRLLKAAPELETLTDDPRQRIEFLHLYAQSLNEARDQVSAVKQLFRLAEMQQLTDDMTDNGAGYSISVRQSIRAQLLKTYEMATADERVAINRTFETEFEAALAADDQDERLTQFVKMALGHPAGDPLLKRLFESNDRLTDQQTRTRLLEHLSRSPNKSVAGFAVAKLASITLALNLPREALPWIEQLGREFPNETCLDQKTGRELFDEWMVRADVRQIAVPATTWPGRPMEVERTRKRINMVSWPVDIVTHVGCHFVGWSFEIDPNSAMLTARDPSLRIVWQMQQPLFAEVGADQTVQMHIRGRRLAISSGVWLVVMESTDSYLSPTPLFDKSLRSSSLDERKAMTMTWERHLLPTGRRFQSAFDIRGAAGFLIGLSDEAVFFQLDNRLIAADAETGRVHWARTGAEFARSDGTVDTTLVLHTANNEAILLRPLDGTVEQRHKGSRDEKTLWFQGTRRLSQRVDGPEQRVLEMRDCDGDQIVWQSQHPAGMVHAIVEGKELAVLEPSGKLLVLDLDSGKTKLTTEIPVVRPHGSDGVLAVQRYGDRYVIVAGVSASRGEMQNVMPLQVAPSPESAFTVSGVACAIEQKTGRVAWSAPVEQLAFDAAQPASLPILLLAAKRQVFPDNFGRSWRLSVLVLDKRNGQTLYESPVNESQVNRGAQFIPIIDEQKLIVDFMAWNLVFTFPQPSK